MTNHIKYSPLSAIMAKLGIYDNDENHTCTYEHQIKIPDTCPPLNLGSAHVVSQPKIRLMSTGASLFGQAGE